MWLPNTKWVTKITLGSQGLRIAAKGLCCNSDTWLGTCEEHGVAWTTILGGPMIILFDRWGNWSQRRLVCGQVYPASEGPRPAPSPDSSLNSNLSLSLKKKKIYLAVPGLSCGIWNLVPWPGSNLGPLHWEQSLSHWTTMKVALILTSFKTQI